MILSISVVLLVAFLSGTSAQPSCGLGSMEAIAPQTMTFVLPTITATITTTSIITSTSTTTTTATITTTSEYPYLDDSMPFPSLLPLPEDIDVYQAYQKIAASTENTTIAWWYEGLSSVIPDGLPETPGLKSQTLQAWRVQQINSTRMRVDWSELILLADFQTGDDASFFYQPQSGLNNTKVPNYYYDGPVTYYMTKNITTGSNGIDLEIIQPGSIIEKSTIQGRLYNEKQIQFYQTEKKIRSGIPLTSILQFIGSIDDVRNPEVTSASGSGYYHAAFSGNISSLFAYPNGTLGDTHILGNVKKQGAANEGISPKQWAEMVEHFPHFFENGVISPNWSSILTTAGLAP